MRKPGRSFSCFYLHYSSRLYPPPWAVSPGMEIPDESLVMGVPARIKGKITPIQMQRLTGGSQAYLELVKLYKKEGL